MTKNELIAGGIVVLMVFGAVIVMGGVIGAFIGAVVAVFRLFT
jgi:hypothetical protein